MSGTAFPHGPDSRPLFYPAWDVLPHEGGLPHADTISDRLETLVQLSVRSTLNPTAHQSGARATQASTLVVTNVTALLQKTISPVWLRERTRTLDRGHKFNPLDLIEWLEEQGYEPEAQVTQKGEIALRGGILDVWPLTSPWPVRLEFFGDELESLRHFDPLTQISREEIVSVTLPPGGELGLLKQWQATLVQGNLEVGALAGGNAVNGVPAVRHFIGLPAARDDFSPVRTGAACRPG